MANTENFVVNGPLEVGTTVVSNKGTATSATISYLPTATYESVSFSVASQSSAPFGLVFKTDGTQAYIATGSTSLIGYALSTAWDISTATYDSNLSTSSELLYCRDLAFKSDGTKLYIIDGQSIDSVYQYSLSTAWDITTASYDSVSLDVSSQDTDPRSFTLNSTGTKLYVAGFSTSKVYEYSLSTAYDLSTASYTGNSLSVSAEDTNIVSVRLNSDDTKLYAIGAITDVIYEYTMSTAGSISTATYSGNSFDPTTQETSPYSMFLKPDDLTMYVVGQTNDTIYQYSLSQPSIDCDLSTGNIFEASTDNASTLLTFSNPSNAQSFDLTLTNNLYYDLSSPTLMFYRTSWPFTYDYFGIFGWQVSYDGTTIWYNSSYYNYIRQATMSTPFDLSTVGNVGTGYDYNTPGYSDLAGFYVTQDGNTMFAAGTNRTIRKFSLSASNNVMSTVTLSQTLDLSSDVSTSVYGVTFKPDGTEMYVSVRDTGISGSFAYYMFQYTLSTAWDLSTATYTNYVSLPSIGYAFSFSEDGTILMFSYGAALRRYDLSTPWDITTATSDTVYTVPAVTANTLISCVDYKGAYIYAFQDASGTGQGPAQFDMRGTIDVITDSSVKTQNGNALSDLTGGETGVYSFSTTDGGTTYQGVKSLFNFS